METFISAMNIYSDKLSNVSEIGQGAKISYSNDTNESCIKVLKQQTLTESRSWDGQKHLI